MKLLLMISIIILAGACSSPEPISKKSAPRVQTSEYHRQPGWDAFHDETFSRWDKRHLAKVSGAPVVQCYQEDRQHALTEFKKSFSAKNSDAVYWLHIGNCYAQEEMWNKAEFFYRLSLHWARSPKDMAMAKNNLAVISFHWEQWDEGNQYLKEAINHLPKFKVPKFNLAQVYLQFRLYKKAISLLEDPVFQGKKDADIFYSLANAHFFSGNMEKAGFYFKQIPKEELTRPEIAAAYSLYLLQNGDLALARTVIEGRKSGSTPAMEKIISKIMNSLNQQPVVSR